MSSGTPSDQTGLSIEQLLVLHDEDLVDEAYRRVLGREADPEGRAHYLHALRTGALAKVEMIGALRYSPEGKRRALSIKGLAWRHLVRRLCRVPLLGYLLDLLISILSLPGFFRRTRAFNSALAFQLRRSSTTVETLTRELGAQLPKIGSLLAGLPTRAKIDELTAKLETKADQRAATRLAERIDEVRTGLAGLERELRRHEDRVDVVVDELAPTARDDALADQLYVDFEETFRGSRKEISRRLEVHIDEIRGAMERSGGRFVVDLGCGRGEWLELLRSHDVTAHGVDISPAMVTRCQELGLVATESDAVSYLRAQPAASCAAVTAFHLIEHLPLPTLLSLIDEMVRVLLPGGVALLETPNPENLIVGACTFYTDPGHRRPLVPESMRFLLTRSGLEQVEVRRLHRYDELFPVHSDDPDVARWLYGPMDYALVGRKA